LLVPVYKGFSEIELSYPISMFSIFGGVDFDIVGLKKETFEGWAGVKIFPDKSLDEIDPDEYDGLMLPGISPFSLEEFIDNQVILSLIKKMKEKGSLLAGICLTPLALAHAGVLNGKTITSDAPPESFNEYENIKISSDHVVRDENIITAKGPAFIQFTQCIFEALGFSELSERLGSFMQDVGKTRLIPAVNLDRV